jgi:hypothetical protein
MRRLFGVIPLDKTFSIEPYVGVQHSVEVNQNNIDDYAAPAIGNGSSTGIKLGGRFMIKLLGDSTVNLQAGGDLRFYSWASGLAAPTLPFGSTIGGFSHFQIGLSAPIAVNIAISKNFIIRISQDVARFFVESTTWTYTNGGLTYTTYDARNNFEFTQAFGPTLGFVFMF